MQSYAELCRAMQDDGRAMEGEWEGTCGAAVFWLGREVPWHRPSMAPPRRCMGRHSRAYLERPTILNTARPHFLHDTVPSHNLRLHLLLLLLFFFIFFLSTTTSSPISLSASAAIMALTQKIETPTATFEQPLG
ncbi:hypothetical protein H109_06323, partial [Trichophyton interdigitale MR816]